MATKKIKNNMRSTSIFPPYALIMTLSLSALADPVSNVVPAVRSWTKASGDVSTLGFDVVVDGKYKKELGGIAQTFVDDLGLIRERPKLRDGDVAAGTIFLTLTKNNVHGLEEYKIDTSDRIVISGATPRAVVWGMQTLMQILIQDVERSKVPMGTIHDWPSFRGRMLMLDVGRKFYPFKTLKEYVRTMAWYKMNELQLHLNDISRGGYVGFRIECETYPELTSKDGSYSKKQIRELIAFAKNRGIVITPEIDSPGHAGCFTKLWPHLTYKDGNPKYLDVTNPETLQRMKSIFDEFIPLFDAPDMHIGTDEYRVRTTSKEEREAVGEKFRQYINDLNDYVRKKGKNVRIWSGYEHMGGTTEPEKNVIIDMWVTGDAVNKSRAGYKFINSNHGRTYIVPGAPYYGVNNAGIYNSWSPNVFGKPENNVAPDDPNLLGGKLHVWNDLGPTGYTMVEIAKLTVPSIRVFSEKTWGTKGSDSYGAFVKRAAKIATVPNVSFFDRQLVKDDDDSAVIFDSGTTVYELKGGNDHVKLPGFDKCENLEYPWTLDMQVFRTGDNVEGDGRDVLISSDVAEFYLDFLYVKKNRKKKTEKKFRGIGFERACHYSENNLRIYNGVRTAKVFDGVTVPKDKWTTITFVGNKRSTKLYVNGKFVGGSRNQMVCPLGSIGSAKGGSFIGKIKNLKVLSKISSKREIASWAGVYVPPDLAVGHPVTASRSYSETLSADKINDDDSNTRWSSGTGGTHWLLIDLGKVKRFNCVCINWEKAFAKNWHVDASKDGKNWKTVCTVTDGKVGVCKHEFPGTLGRYVKLFMTKPGTNWGYSIWDFELNYLKKKK